LSFHKLALTKSTKNSNIISPDKQKYPETLFTKDSTKVYVYLEKQNSNNFDGFIGFNNNENQK
jgi:1,2-phenylacetyl-CoA epoxidase PaaB subunit